jgi:hypothetical protein
MKRFRYLGLFVFMGLVVLLNACGITDPNLNQKNLWTEKKFGTYVQNVGSKSSLATMAGQNTALASLAAIPASGPIGNLAALANPEALQNTEVTQAFLDALSSQGIANHSLATTNNYGVRSLPTGIWEYNKFKNTWTYQGHSHDLIVKFWWENIPYNGSRTYIMLTLDWNALSPTTVVTKGHEKLEVPTGLRIHFNKDNINAGHIDIKIDWYMSACGVTTPEPSYVEVKGKFGHHGSDVAIDFSFNIYKQHRNDKNLVASFENDDYDTRIQSKGYVSVTVGKDSGKVYWDNVFKGYIFRDANCVFTDLKIVYGEIKLGATFTLGGQTDNLELQFTFDNIKKNQYGIQSVDLHNGKILVNGYVVAHFNGTLDASGEKLMLTFKDKTVSLADFLGAYLDGVDLELPVGLLGLLFNTSLAELPSLPFF